MHYMIQAASFGLRHVGSPKCRFHCQPDESTHARRLHTKSTSWCKIYSIELEGELLCGVTSQYDDWVCLAFAPAKGDRLSLEQDEIMNGDSYHGRPRCSRMSSEWVAVRSAPVSDCSAYFNYLCEKEE